ncbi:hypothetical protein C8F04DRAFT_1086785 [Mycena alexandri]|uniref:Uncharacterized protein n=1 Tax=Mycena alexandri TaxID=1745969 RepID=A0AAD6X554_9AGAR|nr:hypothetical protein C8F04DRAFT_1086785 [Mycena alexandri]
MTLFVCALLGTPPGDSTHVKEQLWFLSDFVFAHELIAEEADGAHQVWLTQLDVYEELEKVKANCPKSDHTLLHGPSRSERFELSDRTRFYETWRSGKALKQIFLTSITRFARPAKPNDHLVIFLFGHGDDDIASFGRVECGEAQNGKPVWLLPKEVEKALGSSRARVTLVSTACYAGSWASSSWGLFAPATTKYSIGLPASGSDRMWGSTFWSTIPELAANSHGCTFHPHLIHPQLESFEPPLTPDCLQVLSGSEGSGIPPPNDVMHTISMDKEVAPHAYDPVNGASFEPTIPQNVQWGGWHGILGVQDSINLVLRANRLTRQPANPPVPEVQVDVPLATGSAVGSGEDEEYACASDDEWDSDDECDPEDFEGEGGAVDPQRLKCMIEHWDTTTRPLNLHIAARHSLFAAIQRYRTGTATHVEELKLAVQFQQRCDADALAQSVAEDLGIALDVRCEDFREVDELESWRGIPFIVIEWGSVSPRDVIGLRLRYKKAGQWLFMCWLASEQDQDMLEDVMKRVKGKIYYEWIPRVVNGVL